MDERDQQMQELIELYALGGLEPEERALVEAYLKKEGSAQVLARGRLAAYALSVSVEQQPPAALRERILSAAAAAARKAPATVTPLRPAFWMQPGWLAAAAAVVIVVFAATWAFESGMFGGRSWAVGCTTTATPCTVNGRVVAAGGALRLETHGLQPLPAGKVYQAWYIRAGAKPTPAPTFNPDAHGDATVVLPVGAEKGLTVAVTIEPPGGSTAPTTKPILVASIN
ncbi:MAG TPA: anti-sigma factor [Candidatus Eremiobacteraceae bacterium]|nr:anti-sigma factor [Candidatus Eremiobacteraceae bacterium]